MTPAVFLARVWSRVSARDRFWYVTQLLAAVAWVADTLAGHPIGSVLPDWVASLAWCLVGVVGARLAILAYVLYLVHKEVGQ